LETNKPIVASGDPNNTFQPGCPDMQNQFPDPLMGMPGHNTEFTNSYKVGEIKKKLH